LFAAFEQEIFEIILSVNPTGGGEVTGDGSYPCDSSVTLTATPDDCYTFTNWTDENDNIVSTANPYNFTITESRTLTANFTAKTSPVVAMANPITGGTINGNSIYAQEYACGDTATLFAEPNPGYTFVNWTEDGGVVHSQQLYEFSVTTQHILYANFEADNCVVTLQASPPAGATLLVGGGFYNYGATANITVIPHPCYTFINWTLNGDVVSTQLSFNYTVTGSCTLIANFTQNNYDVTLSVYPSGSGVTIPLPGTHNYNCGDSLTLTAIPTSLYDFVEWQEDGALVSSDNPYTYEVTGNHNLIAVFELKTYNYIITVTADPEDAGTVSGGGEYAAGEMATVTAEADSCHTFAYWMENDYPASIQNPYVFEVTGNRDLVAIFTLNYHNITVLASAGGTVTNGGNFACGDTITIMATSDDCWKFINWTNESGAVVSQNAIYTFIVTEDAILTANFEETIFNLVVLADPPEGGVVTGGASNIPCVSGGTFITVEASLNSCYTFAGWWTPDGTRVSTETSYTFNLNEYPYDTLFARFEIIAFNITLAALPPDGGTTDPAPDTYLYSCDTTITVTAIPYPHYNFIKWTDGEEEFTDPSLSFNVDRSRNLTAHFELKNYQIILSADPPDGGLLSGDGIYNYGNTAILSAESNEGYDFDYWTENYDIILDNPYILEVTESHTLVAHFTPKTFTINLEISAESGLCGSVLNNGGLYRFGDTVTVKALVGAGCCRFVNWTINNLPVSTDAVYTFIVTESVTLVANFEVPNYQITALVNETPRGRTEVIKLDDPCLVRVRAYEEDCYRFINWTIDSIEVSANNIYEFEVTGDITLIANFSALDFDTYCPTLWCNTFELDLFKLQNDFGFEIIDCKWYKNGVKEINTRTINQFSYSAGPKAIDVLEPGAVYMFKLITKYHGNWCSSQKVIYGCNKTIPPPDKNLVIFPNPTSTNNLFTVENVIKGETVQVYNQFGICVNSIVAADEVISMTLNDVPSGVYMIRCGERYGKIVVIR
jgi:hypothetical protein